VLWKYDGGEQEKFMDFAYHYTAGQEAFRQEVRSWIEDQIPEGMPDPLDSKSMSKEVWLWVKEFRQALGNKGWLHPTYPKEYGGGGLDTEHAVVIMEELQRVDAPVDGLRFHDNTLDLPAIAVWGTEDQKKEFLPPRLTGEKLGWQLFTEPGAGSDLASLKTRAVKDGDDWIITGEKVFVGGDAGYGSSETKAPDEWQMGEMFCLAITDPNAPRHRNMGYFYIPGNASGVTAQTLDLLVGHGKRQLYLDNVRVPSSRLIGGEAQGWQVAQTTLEIEHGGDGAVFIRDTAIERIFDWARDTKKSRNAHDQQLMVDAFVDNECLRLFSVRNSWLYSAGQEMTYQGSQFALMGKESAIRVADNIREVAGLHSLVNVNDPEVLFDGEWESHQRESLAGAHPGGTIEVQKVIVARRIGVSRTKERAAPTPSTAT